MDTTNRYDSEFPAEDAFEQLVRDAEEAQRELEKEQSKPKVTLTDEQKVRHSNRMDMFKQNILDNTYNTCNSNLLDFFSYLPKYSRYAA